MTTESILLSNGFTFHGKCNCDGYQTLKYANGQWMVKWRISKYTFKLKQGNTTITSWLPISELKHVLEEKTKVLFG